MHWFIIKGMSQMYLIPARYNNYNYSKEALYLPERFININEYRFIKFRYKSRRRFGSMIEKIDRRC
jgi:hypothetical protein